MNGDKQFQCDLCENISGVKCFHVLTLCRQQTEALGGPGEKELNLVPNGKPYVFATICQQCLDRVWVSDPIFINDMNVLVVSPQMDPEVEKFFGNALIEYSSIANFCNTNFVCSDCLVKLDNEVHYAIYYNKFEKYQAMIDSPLFIGELLGYICQSCKDKYDFSSLNITYYQSYFMKDRHHEPEE